MTNEYSLFTMVIFLAVAVAVYFIPTWFASARKHHNANAIFVVNLLLGWTGLGWIIALVWSLTAVKSSQPATMPTSETTPTSSVEETKQCPFCAETIKKAAKVCRYCGRDLPIEE